MLPQRAVAAVSLLQLVCILQRLCVIALILFGLPARKGIDFLQISDGERSLLRIISLIGLVKINQLRLSVLKLGNHKTHLKSPVPKVNISNRRIPVIANHPLDCLTDHCRTKMSHMKRLRHVRSAVVKNHGFLLLRKRHSEFDRFGHFLQVRLQIGFLHVQIDKAGLYNRDIFKNRGILQLRSHILCDHKRSLMILLRTGHCAVALVLRKVRARRNTHLSHCSIIACCRKGFSHLFCQCFQQLFHTLPLLYLSISCS